MRKHLVVTAAIALTASSLTASAQAVTSSTSTSTGTVTYDIPDITFNGPDCIRHFFTVTMSAAPALSNSSWMTIQYTLSMRQAGSNDAFEDTDSDVLDAGESETSTRSIFICPFQYNEDAGPFQVNGEMRTGGSSNPEETKPFTTTQVLVNKAQSQISKASGRFKQYPRPLKDSYTFKGKATADTSSGVIGASGLVEIQFKAKKSKRWRVLTTASTNSFGVWTTTTSSSKRLAGKFRAVLTDCDWCTTATKSFKVKG